MEKPQIAFCAQKSVCVSGRVNSIIICIGRLKRCHCISCSSTSKDTIIVLHWFLFFCFYQVVLVRKEVQKGVTVFLQPSAFIIGGERSAVTSLCCAASSQFVLIHQLLPKPHCDGLW